MLIKSYPSKAPLLLATVIESVSQWNVDLKYWSQTPVFETHPSHQCQLHVKHIWQNQNIALIQLTLSCLGSSSVHDEFIPYHKMYSGF